MNFGSTHLRNEVKLKATTLIQFSGGIDSAFVLWDWLSRNKDEYCLVHHINLINHEGRVDYEKQAVYEILQWLDNQELTNYIYLESTFDYGNLGYIIKDVEVCGFFSGIVFRSPHWTNLKNIAISVYDINSKREGLRRTLLREVSYGKDYHFEYPLHRMTKKDVMKAMPEQLLKLCWYCRTPSTSGKCGKCITCKEVLKFNPI